MLYTRLASPVAVCIAIRGRYTRLAWLANPNPNSNPNPINHSRVSIRLAVCIHYTIHAFDRRTDSRTDGFTIASTAWHIMQRGN